MYQQMADELRNDLRAPNFMLIGASKAGTTSLYHHLRAHPGIYMSAIKEPQFFSDEAHYARGLDYYVRKFFPDAEGFKLRGEASPRYLHVPETVIPKLQSAYGDRPPLFLVMLRHPVMRAWSHYRHRNRVREDERSFFEAISQEQAEGFPNPTGYAAASFYARQLAPWIEAFGAERFHVMRLEDMEDDLQGVLDGIWPFLGVDTPDAAIEESRHNVAATPRSAMLMRLISGQGLHKRLIRRLLPDKALRRRLMTYMQNFNVKPESEGALPDPRSTRLLLDMFKDDTTALQDLIGRPLDDWLAPPALRTGKKPAKVFVGVR